MEVVNKGGEGTALISTAPPRHQNGDSSSRPANNLRNKSYERFFVFHFFVLTLPIAIPRGDLSPLNSALKKHP